MSFVAESPQETVTAAQACSPWLTAAEAADYLRAPLSRIRKLCSLRDIPFHKEGRRVLFDRAELDAWIRSGNAAV